MNNFNLRNVILNLIPIKFSNIGRYIYSSRNDSDDVALSSLAKINSDKVYRPTVSAVYRVKNGSASIRASIYSIAPLVNEIIFVDNASSDNTVEIVRQLKIELKNVVDIKIFNYSKKLSMAGDGYAERILMYPESSLADYYTYSFSKATCDYVMKCDAHILYLPGPLEVVASILKNNPKKIRFRGVEVFGKFMNPEPYIFKNDGKFEFYDSDRFECTRFFEKESFTEKLHSFIFRPVYIHIKRIAYIKDVNSRDILSSIYEGEL